MHPAYKETLTHAITSNSLNNNAYGCIEYQIEDYESMRRSSYLVSSLVSVSKLITQPATPSRSFQTLPSILKHKENVLGSEISPLNTIISVIVANSLCNSYNVHTSHNPARISVRKLSTLAEREDYSTSNVGGIPSRAEPRPMAASSKRSGAIAVKCGMTAVWDRWGVRIPVTILWVDDNQVVQVKTKEKEGFTAVQVGFGQKKAKQLTKPEVGHFRSAGVPLKRKLAEFRVTEDALLPVGTPITAQHFVVGQYIDVTGITTGKGFQGGMKRHGYAGMPASHGASLSHRSLGSTGGRQDPGRVFKNKKMAGRMGGKQRTTQNIWIYQIDPSRNLLYVRGQVPGHAGNFVLLRDAAFKKPSHDILPFPTHFQDPNVDLESMEPLIADLGNEDPFVPSDK